MSERKYNQFSHEQINWSDQSLTFPPLFNDLYFNTQQQLTTSRHLFLAANLLIESWSTCQQQSFCIAETSFGSGLNFLLTSQLFKKFLEDNPDKPLKKLFFTSFAEKPLTSNDLQYTLQQWPHLSAFINPLLTQYPLAITGCHRLHFSNICLDLWVGDVHNTLPCLHIYEQGLFNCWYLHDIEQVSNTKRDNDSLISMIARSCKLGATICTLVATDVVKQALQVAGFESKQYKHHDNKNGMLIYQLHKQIYPINAGQNYLASKTSNSQDIAIIGGGISSACLSLALINRGYRVTLYCKDDSFAVGASGNQQGALYPLLNGLHNDLSQLFANSFLYARHYLQTINRSQPFDFDLSGLLQLYYDDKASVKLDKIVTANLPKNLVEKISVAQADKRAAIDIGQCALFYPLGGWLSPAQLVRAIFAKAKESGLLTVNMNHKLVSFEEQKNDWICNFEQHNIKHDLLVLTTAMDTLNFKQCEALPLSAARGQVTHIETNPELQNLKMTLCHEGYLTPINNGVHCMGATFKRHVMDSNFSLDEQLDNKHKLQKCIANKSWVEQINVDHQHANIGIRCTTRDHFPYMGAIAHYQRTKHLYQNTHNTTPSENMPFHNNLFILTGLGSRGLTTAPLLAESLASQINQEPLPLSSSILNSMQCQRQWISYLKKGKKLKF